MKNLLLLLLACTSLHVQAQKSIVKEAAYKDRPITVDLDFATAIDIVTWDKPSLQVKARAVTEDPEYAEMFRLDLMEEGNRLVVSSNSKEVLRAVQKERGFEHEGVLFTNGLEHEFTYQLMVPKGVELDISSITGNITSNYVEGNMTANLVSGNIQLKDFKGDVDLNTVNGRIELPGKDSSVSAKTVVGRIEMNEELGLSRKNRFVGQEVSLENSAASNKIKLKTVNGLIIIN